MFEDDWFDTFMKLVFGSVMFGVTSLLFLLIAAGVYNFTGYSCKNFGQMIGVETRHNWDNGCFLKVGEQFVPKSELTFIEREGKMVIVPKTPHRLNIEGLK